MIEIRNLSVNFGGVHALRNLTVTLDERIVGVIGPNGAGKTTLLNVLSGFVRPTTGTLSAYGENLLALPVYRRARWGLRRTFQTEQVTDDLTVWDNVAVMLDSVPMPAAQRRAQIQTAIDYVGLTGAARRLGVTLNTFERRMCEIGRAVVGKPRIVLMDESGAGLSENEVDALREVIRGIPARFDAVVVLIEHDVDLIASVCISTAVLDFGTLVAYGPTSAVLKNPHVRAAYLGVEEIDDATA